MNKQISLLACAGFTLGDQAAAIVQKSEQLYSGARKHLPEIFYTHLQNRAGRSSVYFQNMSQYENDPMLAIKAKQHPQYDIENHWLKNPYQILDRLDVSLLGPGDKNLFVLSTMIQSFFTRAMGR